MDPKEARDYIGYNVHFNPEMNQVPSTSPPKKHWWNKMPSNTKPIQIQRQLSSTSTGSDVSPVGSPTSAPISPPTFGTHMPQPNMYKQFHFNQ